MSQAYIGLGANLGDPAAQLERALLRLGELGVVSRRSALYRSVPLGPADQPDFCNAVCALQTPLAAPELMNRLLAIERDAGRIRECKWGPRLLDLDLLHVEGLCMDTELLQLPHPGIAQRNFVLVPWAEIAPALEVPGIGRLDLAAAAVGRAGLQLWHAPRH